MQDSPKVVYAAQNVPQAYLLKNLLEQSGIQAIVTNETLAGGSGVDFVGWQTLARVVVDEPDYETARRIALEFDHAGVEAAEQSQKFTSQSEPPRPSVIHQWPSCPKCNARRITHCPVCETTGSDFPEADSEFIWGMGLAELKGKEESTDKEKCQCSSHGCCTTAQPQADEAPSEAETQSVAELDETTEDQPEHLVLVCNTCDEPFLPEFARDCAMCGHRFPDGVEIELPKDDQRQFNSRAAVMFVGMGVCALALIAFFVWVWR